MSATSPRVLVIGADWPPETFLVRLIRGLAGRGMQVTVATATRPDETWYSVPNLTIRHLPGWDGPTLARLGRVGGRLGLAALRSPVETGRLLSIARAGEYPLEQLYHWLPFAPRKWDVIYFPWNEAAVVYRPLLDMAPAVISCRGAQINVAPHNPRRAELRDGLRETFARAAAVHCVSAAIRDEAARYGLDREKAVIIHPAVDVDMFRPAAARRPPDGVFRVITTGAIMWRKGYEYALSAVRRLVDNGIPVRFEIIGDGGEAQRLLFTIHDLGLRDHVCWRGRLSPAEVVAALQSADTFMLASLSEGISNAVLEAMACGLPVVTTDVGGMAEAVTDGVEGFLVPPRHPAAIAEALRELWRQPELREQMGAAGRERASRDFRLDDQIDAYVALFRGVV